VDDSSSTASLPVARAMVSSAFGVRTQSHTHILTHARAHTHVVYFRFSDVTARYFKFDPSITIPAIDATILERIIGNRKDGLFAVATGGGVSHGCLCGLLLRVSATFEASAARSASAAADGRRA
jgi:hypothetical protein